MSLRICTSKCGLGKLSYLNLRTEGALRIGFNSEVTSELLVSITFGTVLIFAFETLPLAEPLKESVFKLLLIFELLSLLALSDYFFLISFD